MGSTNVPLEPLKKNHDKYYYNQLLQIMFVLFNAVDYYVTFLADRVHRLWWSWTGTRRHQSLYSVSSYTLFSTFYSFFYSGVEQTWKRSRVFTHDRYAFPPTIDASSFDTFSYFLTNLSDRYSTLPIINSLLFRFIMTTFRECCTRGRIDSWKAIGLFYFC